MSCNNKRIINCIFVASLCIRYAWIFCLFRKCSCTISILPYHIICIIICNSYFIVRTIDSEVTITTLAITTTRIINVCNWFIYFIFDMCICSQNYFFIITNIIYTTKSCRFIGTVIKFIFGSIIITYSYRRVTIFRTTIFRTISFRIELSNPNFAIFIKCQRGCIIVTSV